jgi:hypothetical protein
MSTSTSIRRAVTLARVLMFGAAGAALPSAAGAQATPAVPPRATPISVAIDCKGPLSATCTGTMTEADSVQRFEIELQVTDANNQGVPGAAVRLHPTSGTIVGDSNRHAGPDGVVRALWLRPQGSGSVGIGVDARSVANSSQAFSATRYIQLTPPKAADPARLILDRRQTFPSAAFENTTLRQPMIVEIRAAASASDTVGTPIELLSECQSHRVVFRGSAGTMTPDTAMPEVYSAKAANAPADSFRLGCRAQSHWTLGAGVGPREARVSIVPGKGFQAASRVPDVWEVRTRPVPRFVLGAVYRLDNPYEARDDGDAVTYRVERTRIDGTKISFDSTDPGTVSRKRTGSHSAGVMVGVASAIPTRWTEWLTVILGMDLTSPLDHQYLGLSILRLLDQPETLPLDIGFLAHFGRIDVLERPLDCRAQVSSVKGAEPCDTDTHWRFRGVGVMFSIDAGTLVAEAIKKIGS